VQIEMIAPDFDLGTADAAALARGCRPPGGLFSFHNSMAQSGKPIEIELRGGDLAALAAAAGDLRARLAAYPGVFEVSDSFRGGKPELQFRLLPSAEALGLTLADLARQVRQAFHGEEAQRIPRGRDDVRVVVRYPSEARRSLGDGEAPYPEPTARRLLAMVAAASLGQGFSAIQRADRERTAIVSADVDVAVGISNAIVMSWLRAICPRPAEHGVRAAFAGERVEQREFLRRWGAAKCSR
jgi:multidrug efflux pump subunit AcrB